MFVRRGGFHIRLFLFVRGRPLGKPQVFFENIVVAPTIKISSTHKPVGVGAFDNPFFRDTEDVVPYDQEGQHQITRQETKTKSANRKMRQITRGGCAKI